MAIPVGIDILFESQEDKRVELENLETQIDSFPIGIKTPLEKKVHSRDTFFRMHYNIEDQIKDNLKNALMTRKGERIGYPDFGTRLHEIYSKNLSEEKIVEFVMTEIEIVVSKYMPNIELLEFFSTKVSDSDEKYKFDKATSFYEKQNSLNLNSPSISKKNKTENQDEIYEIKMTYKIPILTTAKDKTFDIKIYVRTSK